jgi:hypothetical protein
MRVPLAVLVTVLAPLPAFAADVTTSLTCNANAKAWRDYSFLRNVWEGGGSEPFAMATSARPIEGYPLRAKVFSALHTSKPVVRSITPQRRDMAEDAAEFEGHVLLRSADEVFLTWSNDTNKVWLAVVDVRNRKAVVTQTFAGVTSVGAEVETLDCK